MQINKELRNSITTVSLLFAIGFVGLIFALIFGNLSGNLGFTQDSDSFVNETINLSSAGEIPASAVGKSDPSLSSVVLINITSGQVLLVGNYTILGTTINATTTSVEYFNTNVNVSYTVAFDKQTAIDSENLIGNLTQGSLIFYSQFPLIFQILGIFLLVTIFIGMFALVVMVLKMFGGRSGKENFSG